MAGDHWTCAAGDNKNARWQREAEENKRLAKVIADGIAAGIKEAMEKKEERQ